MAAQASLPCGHPPLAFSPSGSRCFRPASSSAPELASLPRFPISPGKRAACPGALASSFPSLHLPAVAWVLVYFPIPVCIHSPLLLDHLLASHYIIAQNRDLVMSVLPPARKSTPLWSGSSPLAPCPTSPPSSSPEVYLVPSHRRAFALVRERRDTPPRDILT